MSRDKYLIMCEKDAHLNFLTFVRTIYMPRESHVATLHFSINTLKILTLRGIYFHGCLAEENSAEMCTVNLFSNLSGKSTTKMFSVSLVVSR